MENVSKPRRSILIFSFVYGGGENPEIIAFDEMKAFILLGVVFSLSIPYKGTSQLMEKMPDKNWWTMTNLNLDIPGSYCYNDSVEYCDRYGRLYTWEAAQKGCNMLGEGWRLPSSAEWMELLKHFGGASEETISDGKDAFATLLRTERPTFGATLGGNRNVDGTYARIEGHGFYWTSTEFDSGNAGFLNFASGRKVLFVQPDMEKSRAVSVRCIRKTN